MRHRSRIRALTCVLGVLAVALGAPSCGSKPELTDSPSLRPDGVDAGGAAGGDSSPFPGFIDDAAPTFVTPDPTPAISPTDSVVTVEPGKAPLSVPFVATSGGSPRTASWQVDRPEIGKIDKDGVFTPAGNIGGVVKVTATVGSLSTTTTITVIIHAVQNGATSSQPDDGGTDGGPGVGGFGGVGGEGLGPPVSDPLRTLLQGTATASSVKLLYPYDKTVWPLGILAPLLQWTDTPAPADGMSIHLSGDYYDYQGFFGRPASLAGGSSFVRHPIPEDVWSAATRSAAGGNLSLELVLAAGGVAYGPVKATWTLSKTQVTGTVYYQSYGTNLVENETGAVGGNGRFGGATLSIRVDSTSPILVAGSTTPDKTGCRVCHSVSALGSRMVVQHGDNYQVTSSYDLNNGFAQMQYPDNGKIGWAGLYPDGSIGLGNSGPITGGANNANAATYDMATGKPIASTGLTDVVTKAGLPSFSPDGKHVAFNFFEGPGNAATGTGDGHKLVMMDFDRATMTFSNAVLLAENPGGGRPGWPTFLSGGEGLLFEVEGPGSPGYFETWKKGKGTLWWVDFATKTARSLDTVNGKENGAISIPTGPNRHDDDTVLNYEPSVPPTISGGYAWVIFTSRRLYGNTATIDPWWSDPRAHDLTKTPTPKKLWAAAIDLHPAPGADPSHPAFYVPGQEILAGNSRPFWVLDPCIMDGAPCGITGPQCSKMGGKCQVSDDCCATGARLVCVQQQCAPVIPR